MDRQIPGREAARFLRSRGPAVSPPPPFLQRALRAWLLGLPGIVALPFLVEAPAGVPAPALMAGPAILLAAAAIAGAWAAPRAGAISALVLRDRPEAGDLARALAAGLLAGLAVALADHALLPLWRAGAAQPPSLAEGFAPSRLALGILYGGVTEEIMLRWGVASLVAALALLVLPRRAAIAVAVVASAGLFAAAHLPAAFAGGEAWHAGVLLRTLGWNALLGLVFGAIFFRKGLEAAIMMHAGFHCGAAMAAAL